MYLNIICIYRTNTHCIHRLTQDLLL